MVASPVEYLKLYEMDPEREEGQEHWYARGQDFVVVYSRLQSGTTLQATISEYEHFVLLETGEIVVSSGSDSAVVSTRAAVIVPPGRSTIAVRAPSVLVRVFAPPTPELLSKCVNQATYAKSRPDTQPFSLWPEPKGGYRLRVYEFDAVPQSDFLRSRNLAVQWNPYRESQPGQPLGTPHYHDYFEHTLFCVSGEYVYHMRYPWGTDRSAWRDDEHVPVKTPSLAVVPPMVTHVAEAVGTRNSMIDISAPPRPDLMLQLRTHAENAAEYPLPRQGSK